MIKKMYAWISWQSAMHKRERYKEQMTDSWCLGKNTVAFKHCLSITGVLKVNIFDTKYGLKCTCH